GLKLGPIRTAQFLARSLAARLGRSCRGSGRRSARSWARGLDLPHRWKRKMTAPARGGAREVLGMKRREVITLLGGTAGVGPRGGRAVVWPLAARAQQPEKTDWEKNHARDRSCFAQHRNNGFAAHRR